MPGKQQVRFDFIRYANCWEDADLLLASAPDLPGSHVLSICSGGDNTLALLLKDPEMIIAADLSPVQLYLAGLKMAAMRALEYEEFLAFAGFEPSDTRSRVFSLLKKDLSPEARAYWERNQNILVNGLIFSGKFERYFALFRKFLLPLVHGKKRVEELFMQKSREEQERFYVKRWNTFAWKLLFKVFFSRYILGRFGRDPRFLDHVEVPVAENIYDRAGRELASERVQKNYLLSFILRGTFGHTLPVYARKENYQAIREKLPCIRLFRGAVHEVKEEGFKFMNLSNIFEYMDGDTCTDVAKILLDKLCRGGRLSYWNLLAPRDLSLMFLSEIRVPDLSLPGDKGFFYSRFCCHEKL